VFSQGQGPTHALTASMALMIRRSSFLLHTNPAAFASATCHNARSTCHVALRYDRHPAATSVLMITEMIQYRILTFEGAKMVRPINGVEDVAEQLLRCGISRNFRLLRRCLRLRCQPSMAAPVSCPQRFSLRNACTHMPVCRRCCIQEHDHTKYGCWFSSV